jgi:hypothetical protein
MRRAIRTERNWRLFAAASTNRRTGNGRRKPLKTG